MVQFRFRVFSAVACFLLIQPLVAEAQETTWRPALADPTPARGLTPGVRPDRFQGFVLDRTTMQAQLATARDEAAVTAAGTEAVVSLPLPDGSFARYLLVESSIMEPLLQAKFPEIRTYVGQGIDDPSATIRADLTPQGFHAQILSPRGAVYIDPYWIGATDYYAVYYKKDLPRREGFACLTPPDIGLDLDAPSVVAGGGWDGDLRTYRLACAATGEYTAFHGGTVALGLAAVVTAVNRVTGVYETEIGARLVLVANNNLIIYTNSATDPYTNADGGAMLGQNQSNLNTVIGSSNYDIGHVFSTGGGGIAALRAVCRSTTKAQGVTGLPSPIGDAFYIDYVAHEMGHQFGANHTFNGTRGSCGPNRNPSTAYEPGSGSTIMPYSGICGLDNLQTNSDPYFHFASLDEIRAYITTSTGNTCPARTPTGNNAPTVNAGADYTIPAQTPFELTAAGNDPDGDPVTYCWEERDLGPAAQLNAPDDGQIPLFRSWPPTSDPTRVFPRLSNLLNNTSSLAERLPLVSRIMDMRVTVRDNIGGAGAFVEDDMQIVVTSAAGPFEVTAPNTAVTLAAATTVTWNVANTDLAPVSAAAVDILLSVDGGFTYPFVLESATPNDGSQTVTLPDLFTTTARIKVRGAGNIFFDVSNTNFTIQGCSSAAAPMADPSGTPRNRYLSFIPGAVGFSAAVKVTLVDLPPPFDVLNGAVRWLGPPQSRTETGMFGGSYTVARLQCEPFYQDWGPFGLVHAYGPEVVPAAMYDVQLLQCDAPVATAGVVSLPIQTARWGDIAAAFSPPSAVQPDALDIVGLVDRFRGVSSAPPTVSADLYPDVPDQTINALDITVEVDAFRGFDYPFPVPGACSP